MIQLIIGEKGKGKTKVLLEKANTEIKTANGNSVYLDKSAQHMYELNNKIRLIDVTGYPIGNCDEFLGWANEFDLATIQNFWDLCAELFPRIMTWNRCIWTVS